MAAGGRVGVGKEGNSSSSRCRQLHQPPHLGHALVRAGQPDHAGVELFHVVAHLRRRGSSGRWRGGKQQRLRPQHSQGNLVTRQRRRHGEGTKPGSQQLLASRACATPSRCGSTDRKTGTTCTPPASFSARTTTGARVAGFGQRPQQQPTALQQHYTPGLRLAPAQQHSSAHRLGQSPPQSSPAPRGRCRGTR